MSLARQAHPIPAQKMSLQDAPCRHCGAIDKPTIGPGSGPHAASAWCPYCDHFIQWLSRLTPDQRAARAAHFKRQAMAGRPVTEAQRHLLKALGHENVEPANRLAAAQVIDALLKARKGVRR